MTRPPRVYDPARAEQALVDVYAYLRAIGRRRLTEQPAHASTERVGGVHGESTRKGGSHTPAVRDLSTSADSDSGGRGARFPKAITPLSGTSSAAQKATRSTG